MDTTTITEPVTDTTAAPVEVTESNPVGHGNDGEHGKPSEPGEGHTPVTLCHNGHTITVDDDGAIEHLAHHDGDYVGTCLPVEPEPVEPEPIVPVLDTTPTVLCHDGDTITLPAWEASEHFTLGDVAGECGPEWHPVPIESNPVGPVACTYEDGSQPGQAFPCYWDATVSGNGEGCSYTLTSADALPAYDDAACTFVPDEGQVIIEVQEDGTIITGTPVDVPVAEAQALDLVDAMLTPAPVAEVSTAVPTSNPVGLAETGAEPLTGLLVAAALVVAGIASLIARRVAA